MIDIGLTLNAKKSICYYFNADLYSKGSFINVGVFYKRNQMEKVNNEVINHLLLHNLQSLNKV
ncbi:hypothetical protein GCM10008107_24440 [Psychrosphaera saromensis]|nr:hypothetical protein GCM10008107_24440 [Psychrosphaera saromensis]GLQ12557.1 hypothetical protein GCM10007917_00120 [Psychrosphaera saromensis]